MRPKSLVAPFLKFATYLCLAAAAAWFLLHTLLPDDLGMKLVVDVWGSGR